MGTTHLIFLSIPGLRTCDVTRETTPTLYDWANSGTMTEMTPTFPCVTSPAQASFWTGENAATHGVIANGFYDRERRLPEFWVARNGVVGGEQVWDALRAQRPETTSCVWHAQNIKDCGADYIVTPEPIHEPDGTMKLWCYSKPEGLYQELLDEFGHFPLQHYWGPLSNIESTKWILDAAARIHERHTPHLHWIYLPHLDYASQKHGPNSEQSKSAVQELDAVLTSFSSQVRASKVGDGVTFLVGGEYALTDVSGAVYPNRALRERGLLSVTDGEDGETLDLASSKAFAMVDHQLVHVYVSDPDVIPQTAKLIAELPGVSRVLSGDQRDELGMGHERAGDIVGITTDDRWFAYYWWLDDAKAPGFARTVDIHRKPGYDPVELFFDPKTRSIPLNANLVKGSHGVPATGPQHRTALICSNNDPAVLTQSTYRDTDIKRLTLALLGCT